LSTPVRAERQLGSTSASLNVAFDGTSNISAIL
jgi:hypothetical protein